MMRPRTSAWTTPVLYRGESPRVRTHGAEPAVTPSMIGSMGTLGVSAVLTSNVTGYDAFLAFALVVDPAKALVPTGAAPASAAAASRATALGVDSCITALLVG